MKTLNQTIQVWCAQRKGIAGGQAQYPSVIFEREYGTRHSAHLPGYPDQSGRMADNTGIRLPFAADRMHGIMKIRLKQETLHIQNVKVVLNVDKQRIMSC